MQRLLFGLLSLTAIAGSAFALDATSRIDRVALYPSGATITRVASLELPAGTTTVRLAGLVSGLDPDELRVHASADDVVVGQVQFARAERRDAFNAEVDRLDGEIRDVEARISTIDDAIRSEELEIRFLESLAEGYAKEAWHGGAQGAADVGSWREALALLESASGDAYAEIRRQKASRTEAERDLSVLERELESLRGGARASSVLEVTLRSPRALSTELRLDYFQAGAQWTPQYEVRLDSESARLELIRQAEVAQGTDEAWNGVALSLSTSDPSGRLEPGTVGSEFLDLAEPQTAAVRQRTQQLAGAPAADLEEVTVAGARGARMQIGNFAVTYEIPGRVTVSNDADEAHAFDIDTMTFDVELVTRVVPRHGEEAFLAARFDYDRDVPLHASALRVYVDGAYAGVAEMPTALPQSEITMPMGADRRVEVKVVNRGQERGREGIVSRRNTETTDYLFEITNRRASPTLVEVIDRYPVARNEDIEVDVPRTATEPTETDVDERPGVILWRRELPPNEPWRIEHRYTVSYPSDKALTRRRQ